MQRAFYAAADDLRIRVGSAKDKRLQAKDEFYWNNLKGFIDWASRAKADKAEKISAIESFGVAVASGEIFPDSFRYTDANPNSETLKRMFARLGITHCFAKVATVYQDALGRTYSEQLIGDTLDDFLRKRHQAAHNGYVSGLTRTDVARYDLFIRALAPAVGTVLLGYLAAI